MTLKQITRLRGLLMKGVAECPRQNWGEGNDLFGALVEAKRMTGMWMLAEFGKDGEREWDKQEQS